MSSEFMVSFLLVFYTLGIYFHQHIKTDFITHFISFFFPCSLVLVYFFNVCFAQNLYFIFYPSKQSYAKRERLFKYIGLALFIVTLVISLILNENKMVNKNKLKFNYFNEMYILILFLIGFVVIIFVAGQLYYIINRDLSYLCYFESDEKLFNGKISKIINISSKFQSYDWRVSIQTKRYI